MATTHSDLFTIGAPCQARRLFEVAAQREKLMAPNGIVESEYSVDAGHDDSLPIWAKS